MSRKPSVQGNDIQPYACRPLRSVKNEADVAQVGQGPPADEKPLIEAPKDCDRVSSSTPLAPVKVTCWLKVVSFLSFGGRLSSRAVQGATSETLIAVGDRCSMSRSLMSARRKRQPSSM
jgi:hypothetical protein